MLTAEQIYPDLCTGQVTHGPLGPRMENIWIKKALTPTPDVVCPRVLVLPDTIPSLLWFRRKSFGCSTSHWFQTQAVQLNLTNVRNIDILKPGVV